MDRNTIESQLVSTATSLKELFESGQFVEWQYALLNQLLQNRFSQDSLVTFIHFASVISGDLQTQIIAERVKKKYALEAARAQLAGYKKYSR